LPLYCGEHFGQHKKNLNACRQTRSIGSKYVKIAFAAGAMVQIQLGELTALPQIP